MWYISILDYAEILQSLLMISFDVFFFYGTSFAVLLRLRVKKGHI